MFKGKNILISPLDWGLGHATRCVPVIRGLEKNNKITIGVTPLTRNILTEEFPDLDKIDVPAYNISYSSWMPLWMKLLFQWPSIKRTIKQEKELVEVLVKKNNFDIIISDNRYGFYSEHAHSVFITHQLFLKAPFANPLAQKINRSMVQKFTEVWVPDFADEEMCLSGELSRGNQYHPVVKYIGPQSRLNKLENEQIKYDVLFLLSGPEPQQSFFGKKALEIVLANPALKFAMVSNSFDATRTANVDVYKSPSSRQLSEILAQSTKIICRSGYSTLMDLYIAGKTDIVFVPTPGQTEQEYLANYWQLKFGTKRADNVSEIKMPK